MPNLFSIFLTLSDFGTPNMKDFNPLTTTAGDLQTWYADGSLSCEEAVEVYLKQIIKFNHRLHAVIQTTPPDLLRERAQELDRERKHGKPRGPLHGIPVLVKVGHVQ